MALCPFKQSSETQAAAGQVHARVKTEYNASISTHDQSPPPDTYPYIMLRKNGKGHLPFGALSHFH